MNLLISSTKVFEIKILWATTTFYSEAKRIFIIVPIYKFVIDILIIIQKIKHVLFCHFCIFRFFLKYESPM